MVGSSHDFGLNGMNEQIKEPAYPRELLLLARTMGMSKPGSEDHKKTALTARTLEQLVWKGPEEDQQLAEMSYDTVPGSVPSPTQALSSRLPAQASACTEPAKAQQPNMVS